MIMNVCIFVNMKEQEIIENALTRLRALSGTKLAFKKAGPGEGIDGHLLFGNNHLKLPAQIKNEVRIIPLNLPPAFQKEGAVVIAGYITPGVKDQMRQQAVNYLDAAGNCFIRFKDLFLFIENQKITPLREKPDGKLWTAGGLKYIWAILRDPDLINESYRVQAERAGAALGAIGGFLAGLQKEAYIAATGRGRLLEKTKELEEKWTTLYPRILKPKLLMGSFRFAHQTIPKNLPKEMLWGGEPAAQIYTGYLKAEIYTIYTWLDKERSMKKLQLLPDPAGKVLLYEGFWRREFNGDQVVPEAMLYADLVGTGDSRNMEAARRIYKI